MNRPSFLIVRLSALGDVVHTLPAVMDLRAAFPDSRIDWLVEPASAPLLRRTGILDDVVELPTRQWRRRLGSSDTWREIASTLRLLRARRYDTALDFQGLWKSAVPARMSGAKRVAGLNTKDLREPSARLLYHDQAGSAGLAHQVERNRHLAAILGTDRNAPARYPRMWDDDEESRVRQLLQTLPRDFLILNPGAGWATKQWSPERFGTLARGIGEKTGYAVVCTLGPNEEALASTLAEHAHPVPVTSLQLPLTEFACFVRHARMFIGGDTGPMHIADAYGVPVLAILGPTTAERNGPHHARHRVVQHLLPCSHCYKRECDHHTCLRGLEVPEVWRAFRDLDAEIGSEPALRPESLMRGHPTLSP